MGNEIQLTDGIARLLQTEAVCACGYEGRRYDCGSKLGFLEATLAFALKHPQLGAEFQQLIDRAATASKFRYDGIGRIAARAAPEPRFCRQLECCRTHDGTNPRHLEFTVDVWRPTFVAVTST